MDKRTQDETDAQRFGRSWPFEEARRLIARRAAQPAGQPALFATGYGPSGLPHIGTFAEVVRTSMVRHAYATVTGAPTRLICCSDDMDGLRKVPTNVPNQAMLAEHLGRPLTSVPDPFGTHESFGAHNNARLRSFLDSFGFQYEFVSATANYRAGVYDATLLAMLAAYDEVMAIILPTLGPERRASYAPFLPICPDTGVVLQVPMLRRDVAAGTVTYTDPASGREVETPVTGGRVKCQWKADWALRWVALGVDYEMAGKDLTDSIVLSSKIARALGSRPPETYIYEMFLDGEGHKISKSKGNGIAVEDWLAYAPPESLSLYMFGKPRVAKRLHFDVIPKATDEYAAQLAAYASEDATARLDNPVWHIHAGAPPAGDMPVTFALLLNLVSASNASDRGTLWGFIGRYAPGVTPATHPQLDRLVGYALRYYDDFIAPNKRFRTPDAKEIAALAELGARLGDLPEHTSAEDVQTLIYAIGKQHGFEPLRAWFQALYEVLLGQTQGPRFGSFVALYGIARTRTLIADRLCAREPAHAAE